MAGTGPPRHPVQLFPVPPPLERRKPVLRSADRYLADLGDIGRLPIQHVCEDKLCCNPLHIRIQGVPHFHHNRRLATIELNATARQLITDTTQFLQITREQAPARFRRIEKLSVDWIRLRAESGEPLPSELIQQGGFFDGS